MCHDTEDTTDEPRPERAETSGATVRHEWHRSDTPSGAVVEAVATATDRAITDLPPLAGVVDPDALDKLLTDEQSSAVNVSFHYAGAVVSVTEDGTIVVETADDA